MREMAVLASSGRTSAPGSTGDLGTFSTRLRKTYGDGLLAALHDTSRSTGPQSAPLHLVHRALDFV